MKNTKFVKAVCSKTSKKFGLEVKQFGSQWKVVNFVDLSDSEAALITSEVKQDKFLTNDNLLACEKCGSRTVGGCNCAHARQICTRRDKFNFQCVYCKHLQIDYSAPSLSGHREGEVVRLSQGQEVKIQLPSGNTVKRIEVGVGWDPTEHGENMDIDSSVVVAGSSGYETVYFGDLNHPSGCVKHHGDNLTGEDKGDQQGDDENITVYLDKVPQDRDKLVFVLNIYKCVDRHQKFDNVRNLYIKLYEPTTKKTLIEYKVDSNLKGFTALIIGVAYRRGGDWHFKAIGRGNTASTISELARNAANISV